MTIMTGLIIAIKDYGFLALMSIAAPIYVSDIPVCRKVPLPHTLRLTYFIDRQHLATSGL